MPLSTARQDEATEFNQTEAQGSSKVLGELALCMAYVMQYIPCLMLTIT